MTKEEVTMLEGYISEYDTLLLYGNTKQASELLTYLEKVLEPYKSTQQIIAVH